MSTSHKILSVLLVLMLTGSNLVLSGHVSSHAPTDSGLCSLCVHAGGLESADVAKSDPVIVVLAKFTFGREYTSSLFQPVILHDHQSRAPPSVA
jgi:hypothetical protein